jgi:precorrin-2 dehydrogenase / sirohydrochlorin ferrochelatase
MRYYPMFVSLEGRACLVVGAGQVGLRKILSLAECGAKRVLVLECREPDDALRELAARPSISVERRDFAESDLNGMFLAIAATSDAALNQRIAALCQARGVLCNVTDAPEDGSFIVPSSVVRGDLTIAISTDGRSPALTKRIRKDLQDRFGEEYAQFLRLMSRLRPSVLGLGHKTEANSALFRALVGSRLLEAFRIGDAPLATAELKAHLPQELHPLIPELLDGLA